MYSIIQQNEMKTKVKYLKISSQEDTKKIQNTWVYTPLSP